MSSQPSASSSFRPARASDRIPSSVFPPRSGCRPTGPNANRSSASTTRATSMTYIGSDLVRRLACCVAVALALLAPQPLRGQDAPTRTVPDAVSCDACAITVRQLVRLGAEDGDGSLSGFPTAVRADSRGRYWVLEWRRPPLPTHRLAATGAGRIWAAEVRQYRLVEWTADGERGATLERNPDWFDGKVSGGLGTSTSPPPPAIQAIDVDDNGRIWVFVAVAADTWREA